MPLPIWAKNILFLLVYMISGLILVIIIEDLLTGTELVSLNQFFESAVVSLRTPILTTFIVLVSQVGKPFVFASLAFLMAALFFARGSRHDAALTLVAMGLAIVSLTLLKDLFQISRPASNLYHFDGWSFPSGHATLSSTFFFLLSYLLLPKIKEFKWKLTLVLGSIFGTLLVSFSRLYLGAHWVLDVLAGMALGLLSVSFTVLVFNLLFSERRSFRKVLNI